MQSWAKRYQHARINAGDREKNTAQERHLTLIERAERDNDERACVTWRPSRYPCRGASVVNWRTNMAKIGWPVASRMVKRRTHQHEHPRRPIVLLERRAKRGKAPRCPRMVKRRKCMAAMNMLHRGAAKHIPNVAERSESRG